MLVFAGAMIGARLVEGVDALDGQPWGEQPPPWAPGRREEATRMERVAAEPNATRCLSDVDIFCDLPEQEMQVHR